MNSAFTQGNKRNVGETAQWPKTIGNQVKRPNAIFSLQPMEM
jgi:hypothetical protein